MFFGKFALIYYCTAASIWNLDMASALQCMYCARAPNMTLDITHYCSNASSYSLGKCSEDGISCISTDLVWTATAKNDSKINKLLATRNTGCLTEKNARTSAFYRLDPAFGTVDTCYQFDNDPVSEPTGPISMVLPNWQRFRFTIKGQICICLKDNCNSKDNILPVSNGHFSVRGGDGTVWNRNVDTLQRVNSDIHNSAGSDMHFFVSPKYLIPLIAQVGWYYLYSYLTG